MSLKIGVYFAYVLLIVFNFNVCFANVELKKKSELKFKKPPVDMTFSRSGQWLYLLFKNGDLVVYSYQGELKGKVDVGPGFDQIEPGPLDDEIYLLSSKESKIQIVEAIPNHGIDTSVSPQKGAADAPVVIVEYTDFQCPYCAELSQIFNQLLKQYPEKIKIVYKSFPLGNHQYAWKAAANAMAADQKGKFWEFHDRLFENYDKLNDKKIIEIRKALNLDAPEFEALTKSTAIRTKVAADRKEGQRIGVRGTPSVFINGKQLKDKSLEGFKKAIESELKRIKE